MIEQIALFGYPYLDAILIIIELLGSGFLLFYQFYDRHNKGGQG